MTTEAKGRRLSAAAALRALLAVLLLGALFYFVDFADVLAAFRHIDAPIIAALVVLSVVLIWMSCVKWQLFVKAAGYRVKVTRLMSYYTMSYFFNMFLPSSLGGDVARSVQLGRYLGDQERMLAATFIERLTGFFAMTLIGAVFVLVGAEGTAGLELPILALFSATLIGSLPAVSHKASRVVGRVGEWAIHILPGSVSSKLSRLFQRVLRSLDFARGNPKLLFKALVLSMSFHVGAVINTYVCAHAVGWESVSFARLSVTVPLVLIVSAMPVTPSSIGVQEGAFVFFLSKVGATQPEALGIALILRAKNVLVALVGGLLWVFQRHSPRAAESAPVQIDAEMR